MTLAKGKILIINILVLALAFAAFITTISPSLFTSTQINSEYFNKFLPSMKSRVLSSMYIPKRYLSSQADRAPKFTYAISTAFHPKSRTQSQSPLFLRNRKVAERNYYKQQLAYVEDALKSTKGSKKSIQVTPQMALMLKRNVMKIEHEIELLGLVEELNMDKPIDYIKALNKKTENKEINSIVNDFEIFDRDTGEDSFFVTPSSGQLASNGIAFAVADGVGGWSTLGIDPSAVSKGLCFYLHQTFCQYMLGQYMDAKNEKSSSNQQISLPAPKALLNTSYTKLQDLSSSENAVRSDNAKSDKKELQEKFAFAGGTTACLGIVSSATGSIRGVNLGDSGISIYRSGKIAYQSKPQVHAFNTPFQLNILPTEFQKMEEKHARELSGDEERGARIQDSPLDADQFIYQLKHGDVVVLSTDGFLDNVFPSKALDLVTKHMQESGDWIVDPKEGIVSVSPEKVSNSNQFLSNNSASSLANKLTQLAYNISRDSRANTPFSKELSEVARTPYTGGKEDDITVMVLYVRKNAGLKDIKASL